MIPFAGQPEGNDPMSIWEEVERPAQQAADQGTKKDADAKRRPSEPKKGN
jgi:hypothetical protein